ncbi:RICIN domain-containing protein [Nostoc sp. FACHB-152]|uniref:RICIN domain-containing protein n=1 Tax=unclassified Nostoc TaxID=2593658 RepID=UPI0016838F39|nr:MULTISPECIES: RICIN domain-containing protein [unclassified Nostoc]MBD2450156.1 RICIN domain-containing protein [Nostoc sp. FACHB-152]MBD2471339.1 RICIN domain-containing protein [Nostoc sp. FACHB-145]
MQKRILLHSTISFVATVVTCILASQAANSQIRSGIFIINELSNKCIDVAADPGTVNGTPLQLWDCELSGFSPNTGSPTDQKWEFISGGFIRNVLSNKCIDVAADPGTVNGTPLQLWDCELSGFSPNTGSPTDQKWEYIGAGFIKNQLSNKCIDVTGNPATANGTPLQLWDCELSGFNPNGGRSSDQRWRLIPKF